MSSRTPVKSAFENLRPTILREPTRSAVSAEAEARLLDTAVPVVSSTTVESEASQQHSSDLTYLRAPVHPTSAMGALLQKKKRERLLLVSFRMPQSLKEKLEQAAKTHEINQTDLINEAIEMNLQRYI